jgi:membrane protein DedA with SNARE-associated domain
MGLSEILDTIIAWSQSVISATGYPGLLLVMFLENVFPPIPSEVILPLAGSLALEGRFTLLGITAIGALGSVIGAFVFYAAGRALGESRIRELLRRFGRWFLLSEEDLDKALAWFQRYGEPVIFFGRMVPIVRSLVSIPAGIARMRLERFSLYTAIGTALWSFLLALAGYLLGHSWPAVSEWIDRYETVVFWLAIGIVVAFVGVRLWQRLRPSGAPQTATVAHDSDD